MKRKSSVSNIYQVDTRKPLVVVDEISEHRESLMTNYDRKRADTIIGSYNGSPMSRNLDSLMESREREKHFGTAT